MTSAERTARYIKAAKLIEDGDENFCCFALATVDLDCEEMRNLFQSENDRVELGQGRYVWMFSHNNSDEENRDNRVLGLCFMTCVVRRP